MKARALILLLTSLLAVAALADAVTISAPWLVMDPGARAGGMGRAFTAVADDVYATYFNPGGLGLFSRRQVGMMHSDRSIGEYDMYYEYLGGAYNLPDIGTFGLSAIYHDTGLIPITKDDPQPLGYMSTYSFSIGASYGYPIIPDVLGVGGTVKYVYEHLADDATAGTVGGDLGVLWRTPLPKLSLGAAVMNIGGDLDYSGGGEDATDTASPLPRMLKLGLAYEVPFTERVDPDDPAKTTKLNELRFAFDYTKYLVELEDDFATEIGEAALSAGAEYWYAGIVGLRVGYYYEEDANLQGTSFGVSLRYAGFQFDFAQVPEGELFGMKNRFSLSYMW
ncbi:MAG: PorV/PorQ family protein [Candidatus Coatesbacteria bacterium]|nr:PorV/PorQ family protein [Candidatus Coatesbacteria bacterium]